MSNVKYSFSEDGKTGYGLLYDGTLFQFDAEDLEKIQCTKWYRHINGGHPYLMDCNGKRLHHRIMPDVPKGYEVDHINLDTLDNRKCNLRICTHQQNQCNQPLQKNNTSGISGVSFYPPRNKYRARIKAGQHDIHLGYYLTLVEAIQARNVGIEYMFGEYGRYNDVPEAPEWIRHKVQKRCGRFADFSVCGRFLFEEVEHGG